MNVALYIRVSSDEQARHGLSVSEQRTTLLNYAEENNYTVVDVYADEGVSASKQPHRRHEFQRMIRDCENGLIEKIVFLKLDRWFRSVRDYYRTQDILDECNVTWECVTEDYDTATRAGKLNLNIRLAIAEDEAANASERVKFIFNGKLNRNEAITGMQPFGYKIEDKKIVKEINSNSTNIIDMIVLDEAHVCKNSNSQQGENLLKLTKAKYQIGATGTLLLNDPIDCLVPLKWIGVERSCKSVFEHFYYRYDDVFGNQIIGFKNLDVLKDQISKYSLRRDKSLLNLPPKMVIPEYIEMDETQSKFYQDITNKIIEEVDKVEISTVNLLSMIVRLRQATALPSILTTSPIKSAKIQRAIDLTRQIISSGEKVVIFSTFKEPIYELQKELKDLNPLVVTGDTKTDPVVVSEEFQKNPDKKVFLGTWQKAGTGIDLYAASYLIFIDTPWTEGVFTQCSDRIYRIGTSKNVFIYNLITKDTIDEKVWELVQLKGAISDYIIDDKLSENSITILRKYIENLKR